MEYGIEKFAERILNDVDALVDFAKTRKQTKEQWYLDLIEKLKSYINDTND